MPTPGFERHAFRFRSGAQLHVHGARKPCKTFTRGKGWREVFYAESRGWNVLAHIHHGAYCCNEGFAAIRYRGKLGFTIRHAA